MLTLMYPDKSSNSISQFRDECGNPQHARCIDGSVTSQSKCSGYCKCSLHTGYLTEKHIKEHQCNEKECAHFYTRTAAAHKPMQKMKTLKKSIEQSSNEILAAARKTVDRNEGLCVTGILNRDNGYVIFCAAIASYNLDLIAEQLALQTGVAVRMQLIPGGFDTHAQYVAAKQS